MVAQHVARLEDRCSDRKPGSVLASSYLMCGLASRTAEVFSERSSFFSFYLNMTAGELNTSICSRLQKHFMTLFDMFSFLFFHCDCDTSTIFFI